MKHLFYLLVSLIILTISGCRQKHEPSQLLLWYQQPAQIWTEALPVGNGRLGAMIFGNPFKERIQLNEESLWAGSQINSNNPEAIENLSIVQQLILDNNLEKATQLIGENMLSTPPRNATMPMWTCLVTVTISRT